MRFADREASYELSISACQMWKVVRVRELESSITTKDQSRGDADARVALVGGGGQIRMLHSFFCGVPVQPWSYVFSVPGSGRHWL